MKESKKVVGLLALTLLLFGYGIWVTFQMNQLKASYRLLEAKHRALAASAARDKVDLLRATRGATHHYHRRARNFLRQFDAAGPDKQMSIVGLNQAAQWTRQRLSVCVGCVWCGAPQQRRWAMRRHP